MQGLENNSSLAPLVCVDEAIARYASSGRLTQLTDQLGSVIRQIDEAGATQSRTAYSPYGEATTTGDDGGNSTEYTARENDGTGLYFYRARYYDSVLKRFVSEDPIGVAGGLNLYGYVQGNPVNFTDPLGLEYRKTATPSRPPTPPSPPRPPISYPWLPMRKSAQRRIRSVSKSV